MMDINRFWDIIEYTRQKLRAANEDSSDPVLSDEDALAEALAELAPEEIIQFDKRFGERMLSAYHWDLWAALYIIDHGCASDDAFEHFRAELILLGRDVFEAALANADSLADVTPLPWGDEGLIYVSSRVYEEKTGEEFPYDTAAPSYPPYPAGQAWEEEDVPERLPRLWFVFSDEVNISPTEAPPIVVPDEAPHIRVTRGHFENSEGRLLEFDEARDFAIVVLHIFGRPTKVDLSRGDFEFVT